jgi:magnesium transporter
MDIRPIFMNLSTVSAEAAEPEPQSISAKASQELVKLPDIKDLFTDDLPDKIATKIMALPTCWQVSAFYKLPRHQAIAVYQLLNSSIQHQLVESFPKSHDIEIAKDLSPQEKVQLFELLYNPQNNQDVQSTEIENQPDFISSPFVAVQQRCGWLFLLLLASTGTTAVIKSQEHILQHVVVLASFIPLLIAYGGNVSTQTATVVVRALHSQEFHLKTFLGKILLREFIAGSILGIILGTLVIFEVLLWQNNSAVAFVVGLSLFVISVLAALCGALLPFFFQAIGSDPALMAAPLSATIVDVIGILIYLYTARLILHI